MYSSKCAIVTPQKWLPQKLSILLSRLRLHVTSQSWSLCSIEPEPEPLLKCLEKYLSSKLKRGVQLSSFQRLFGCNKDHHNYFCINFFLLCTRFYIYRCKFRKEKPNFQSLLSFIKVKYKSEYLIAAKHKTRQHFQRFIFVIWYVWTCTSSAARQKGLSSCVHQKHAFRDNRICSVWMPLKNRILNVTGWKFTVL